MWTIDSSFGFDLFAVFIISEKASIPKAGERGSIMLLKIGFVTGVAVVASLLALYWVEPSTSGGQALLAVVVFAVVNGVGGLIWRAKP